MIQVPAAAAPVVARFARVLPLVTRRPAILYGVFFGMAFFLSLLASFPYDAVKQRLVLDASQQGWDVRVDALGPTLFGVRAKGVELSPRQDPASTAPPPAPIRIDALTLRPALFPPGVAFSARLAGGEISGSVGRGSVLGIHVTARDLDLAKAQLGGVDAVGALRGEVDLEMPMKAGVADPMKAQGKVLLRGEQLSILGGTLLLPLYGTPTEVSLPRVVLGELNLEVQVEEGTGTVKTMAIQGDDLQLSGTGTVRLDRRLPLSDLNLQLSLKAEPEFQKRLGILGSGLTLLPVDPNQPGWRTAKVTGILGHPSLAAAR